jgi:hypothetical protein
VKNTKAMNKGGSQQVAGVTVTMTHAVHSCGILDDGQIIYGGEAAGYVLPVMCCVVPMAARSISRAIPMSSPTCN